MTMTSRPPRTTSGMVRVVVALLLGLIAVIAHPSPSLAVDYRLEILTGSFVTRPGERVILTVSTPSTPNVAVLLTDPRTVTEVQISSPLTNRDAVVGIVAGDDFTAESEFVIDGPSFRQVAFNDQPAFQINIATSTTLKSQALRVARDGVRALRITVTGTDGFVARATTFINVVSTRSYTPLPVFFIADVDGGPSIQPDGSLRIGDQERERLRDLRDLLYRKPPGIPIGVHLRPELIDSLARSESEDDRRLFTDLTNKLPDNDVLVGTFRSANVASFAAAGLKPQFEAQLLRGEKVLDAVNGQSLPTRGVWVTNEVIDSEGIGFLRGFGVTNVVAIGDTTSAFGTNADQSRPYAMRSDSSGVVLGLADTRFARLLDVPVGTAHESAAALAAEIVAQRDQLATSSIGPAVLSSRQVILASISGTPREPLIATTLLRLLRSSPQVSLRRATALAPTLEGLARIPPPTTVTIDVAGIQSRTNDALAAIESVRDVVATNAGVVDRWIEVVDVANDTSINGTMRESYLQAVLGHVASVRGAVRLPTSSFTFGSRQSDLRITLNNASDLEVSVRLVLASPTGKMEFSTGSSDIVIPARGQQEVVIEASARSNGLIPIELVLSSPSGTVLDVAQVRVRVNAIAGLGRGVSTAFVLLLVAWWIIHARRNTRKKRAKEHPALRSTP